MFIDRGQNPPPAPFGAAAVSWRLQLYLSSAAPNGVGYLVLHRSINMSPLWGEALRGEVLQRTLETGH